MKKTVFDYYPAEKVLKAVYIHVCKNAKNVVSMLNDYDDLVQKIIIRLLKAPYDSKKSAPKTFIINVCKSMLCNELIANTERIKHSQQHISVDSLVNEDGDYINILNDPETAEDILLGLEEVQTIIDQHVLPTKSQINQDDAFINSLKTKPTPLTKAQKKWLNRKLKS